ncbi:dihydroneopterin aldolase [Patiriisocius sp. Uisw_017]|jgi:dihydroneopterin aldolase|uniref:dihydroneopterin aldolase n=1 Tax=Patiriisocius sp. Uisw_017 TaxID=3230968 RepID=UPI0039ED5DCA
MSKIELKNVRIFTNHGCLTEEEKIGSDYLVNLAVDSNLLAAAQSDNLVDTVDYVTLNTIIKEEMAVRSKLLETVGHRIITRILEGFSEITFVTVTISKLNPPIGGDVEAVSVTMTSA